MQKYPVPIHFLGRAILQIVDRKASPSAKSQAKKVLEVVNKELSSPEIDDEYHVPLIESSRFVNPA
jgi:hypothetical protein